MSTETGFPLIHEPGRPSLPDQVRASAFERAPLGRRGYDEQAVRIYLDRLADEIAARDAEIDQLVGENRQLKHALREWHREVVGHDAADLLARAQQQIETQLAHADSYSRQREEEATRLYDEILAEARARAQEEARRLLDAGPAAPQHDKEWLGRQHAYTDALLQALDALAAQVNATRQAFTLEVAMLADLSDPDPGGSTDDTP